MGPTAEIDEIPLLVETHLLVLRVLEQFQLVGFALRPEKVDRFLPGDFPAAEGQVLGRSTPAMRASMFARSSGVKGWGRSKS